MRSEKEMLGLIKQVAAEDPRIRAVYMEGSRANPKVKKDIFQDYDIVYVVKETSSFRLDRQWINRFGERLYMQFPEDGVYSSSDPDNCYGWLMQFTDGNRLDLHVCTAEYMRNHLDIYRVLADKDGIMPKLEETSDRSYWIKRPQYEEFQCTCNEFWWCLNNVAKGLWRQELPYVMDTLDITVRPMLKRMLEWKIGSEHDFTVNAGKSGKYMKEYLPGECYRQYLSTYSNAEVNEIWKAVFVMCELFQKTALEISNWLDFYYDSEEAKNSRIYLEQVKELPADAKKILSISK